MTWRVGAGCKSVCGRWTEQTETVAEFARIEEMRSYVSAITQTG
jgi:hypothetical protein